MACLRGRVRERVLRAAVAPLTRSPIEVKRFTGMRPSGPRLGIAYLHGWCAEAAASTRALDAAKRRRDATLEC